MLIPKSDLSFLKICLCYNEKNGNIESKQQEMTKPGRMKTQARLTGFVKYLSKE